MAANRHGALVVGVSLHEKGVKPVNLQGNRVHDGLAVGGTVVEKHVQQRLVGKVTQASSAGQGDLLDPPEQEKKKKKKDNDFYSFIFKTRFLPSSGSRGGFFFYLSCETETKTKEMQRLNQMTLRSFCMRPV